MCKGTGHSAETGGQDSSPGKSSLDRHHQHGNIAKYTKVNRQIKRQIFNSLQTASFRGSEGTFFSSSVPCKKIGFAKLCKAADLLDLLNGRKYYFDKVLLFN